MRVVAAHSLQARLLSMLLGLVALLWLGAVFMTWRDARHELDELLDGHLAQAAALLVVQQGIEVEDDDEHADVPALHKYAPRVAFQVFHDGQLVMHSTQAGRAPMSKMTDGFATVRLADGAEWRVFATHGAERDIQVYVGEQTASRSSILRAVLGGMLWPLAIALPLLGLAGWWAVRRGLMPLHQLSRVLGNRQPEALEPVVLADMPAEMQPLVKALNALLERIGRMLVAERRFTADAAHELRTPIAAIRAQAQVALAAEQDVALRRHALHATLAGCDRATHLVEQLLVLARLEAVPQLTGEAHDLAALASRVLADMAPLALARDQQLELVVAGACRVAGSEMLLAVLLRNLVDNAMRYSPPGAPIHVRVESGKGHALLCVEDGGPGLTASEQARLGERFYRPPGQDEPGSGLGWSIVRRIAQVTGAQIELAHSERLGGFAVTVRWPLPGSGKA